MKKLILFLSLLVALVPLVVVMAQGDPTEPAPRLTPGNLVTGTLSAENFAETYIFSGTAGDTVNLSATTTSEALSLVLLVTGPQGNIVVQDSDLTTPREAVITNFALPENGNYIVTVLRGNGAVADETAVITPTEPAVEPVATEEVGAVATTAPAATPAATEGESFSLILTGTLRPPTAAGATAIPTAPGVTSGTPTIPIAQNVTLSNGGISFGLGWTAAVNMNLEIRDPSGGTLFYNSPTTASGGTFSGDVNADCTTAVAENPTEAATWGTGSVPAGSYEVIIYYVDGCSVGGPQEFSLIATVNNETPQIIRGTLNPTQQYLANLTLDPALTWALNNGGVNAGLNVSLLASQIAAATPLNGNTASGQITRTTPAIAYSFQGTANTAVNIDMVRTVGSLDTYLILLDASGRELASNDDRDTTSTNAGISITIPEDGAYTIVATRFGQTIGGTEGSFNLNVTSGAPPVAIIPTAIPGAATTPIVVATVPVVGLTSTLPEGSIEVRLTWNSLADVQLLVRDPQGASVFDDRPQIPSGATLAQAGNVGCTGVAGVTPISYIYWPTARPAAPGVYEIEVWHQNNCSDTTPVTFDLNVQVNNQEIVSSQQSLPPDNHYMITFVLLADGTTEVGPAGFFDMDTATGINYTSRLADAEPISYGNTVDGNITLEERYQLYSFQGQVGDVIRISMLRTSSTLDTAVYLLSQEGIQLAFNDDVPNQVTETRDTNSLIESYGPLTATGTYYIIATHYGQELGGTVGSYRLTLLRTQ